MTDPCDDTPFPKPTAQHEWLMRHVGKWNVACRFFMDPSQPPLEVAATDTCEAHGPFFTVGRFEADMMGMPFCGIATLGYDPVQGHFVSTWIDTINPCLYHFTGNFDASGRVLHMAGKAPAPQNGQLADWRTTEEELDDGSRRFEMFLSLPGAPEMQLFSHVYTRA